MAATTTAASVPGRPVVLLSILLLCGYCTVHGQGRIVLNGAKINLSQGACLVIQNPAANAITRTSGHIISEGENNRIKWLIGTTTGTYIIPWGYGDTGYLPLTFTKAAGTGSGFFLFSTYHTLWQNSSQLPTGVTNINGSNGLDNSAFTADRFWQINAQGYTTRPALSNLVFTYLDSENLAPGNTILESGLKAKRYNSILNSWTDNAPVSAANITANTLTVNTVDATNLHGWWTIGTLGGNRYWTAPSASNSNTSANWSETSGGAGNAGVPTPADVVFFDGVNDADCILNANFTAYDFVVGAGYAGTITQGSNTLDIKNAATFSGGAFLGGSADITVEGLFSISGGTFTSTSGTLDLKKNFILTSGNFIHHNGTVKFSGTMSGSAQTINTVAPVEFNHLVVSNTAANPGLSIETSQNLKGILTLSGDVIVDADGTANAAIFRLLSSGDNPATDAAIASLPTGAQVTGKLTVQRFMSKEGRANGNIYRYISAPVKGAAVSDLQQEIPVTGSFTGKSNCGGCGSSQSMFAYNESVITDTDRNAAIDLNDGYIDFPDLSNTETFMPGRGYSLFVRGALLSTAAWDLHGIINSGNVAPVSLPVSYTSSGTAANDGWNLVGNPFPSAIDWNASTGWTKANLENIIYVPDNGSASALQYASWNGVTGTNGGSRYIATGQAFWVKANGVGTPLLQVNENVKAPGAQATFFREMKLENILRITMANATTRDETVIHFRDDATNTFDGHADARKMYNGTFNIATILPDGVNLAINSMSGFSCDATVPLNIYYASNGSYRLEFSEYESFSDHAVITLSDKFTGNKHNVRNGAYPFTITSDAASHRVGRFSVTFSSPLPDSSFIPSASEICAGQDAIINIEHAQQDMIYSVWMDSVSIPAMEADGKTTIHVPWEKINAGENNFIIRSAFKYCNAFDEKLLTLHAEPLFNATGRSTSNCGPGIVTLEVSGAPADNGYHWFQNEADENAIPDNHGRTFTTPLLTESRTYYVAAVNRLGCEGPRTAVQATILKFEPVMITAAGDSLKSNYSSGNQWYFNGNAIAGATQSYLVAIQPGTYRTEVQTGECTTTAAYVLEKTAEADGPFIITISPNPTKDEVRIEVLQHAGKIDQVSVINGTGQSIGTLELQYNGNSFTGSLKLGAYPAGLYIVQFVTPKGVHYRKVIKE
ncbi:MAG TPA: T9SS type A sorting domain-containing protein [Ohtaekwangia sp.]|nr:T9SS type A sorting domain-containing protein [Ohtaekwangia sp.]